MLDATGPLAWNGRLRGRAVVSGVDRKYFYDEGDLGRVVFYGVTELDLTPATLLSAGLHYSDEHAAPWPDNGLPDDVVAAPSGFPRSEEHKSELPSLMRISYAVFCLKKLTYHIWSENNIA